MGLIINKPRKKISFLKVLKEMDIAIEGDVADVAVHFGGPVEMSRGFVLHSTDYRIDDITVDVTPQVSMTATIDILHDIACAAGPETAILALGYAGWGENQLEGELSQNAWLTCDADPDLVFGADADQKWEKALAKLGISPALLSATVGHA